MDLTLGGAKIGSNTFDETTDGSFTSTTHMEVTGTAIESNLTGHYRNGVLVDFDDEQSAAGNKVSIKFDGGKLTVAAGGKTADVPYNYKGKLFFFNYHPEMMRNLSDVYRADLGGEQKLDIFVPEAGSSMKVGVTALASRSCTLGGKKVSVNGYQLALATVSINLYTVGNDRLVAQDVPGQTYRALDSEAKDLFKDPIAAFPELSQATFETKTLKAVKMRMRDGTTLVADVMLPNKPGRYPIILERTPYGRVSSMTDAHFYASRGYAFVAQDVRGREDSDGTFDPMVNERKDGYDTVQWLAKQPWSDGRVGMIGGSYVGYVQWAAAVEHPAALKCIVPQVSPPDAFENLPYEYGVPMLLPALWWLNIVRDKHTDMGSAMSMPPHPEGMLQLPLTKVPKAVFGYDLPLYTTWLKRDRWADWKGYNIEKDITSVKIPVLHISGWWDGDGIGTMLHWSRLSAAGKKNQWLIEGPWTHAFNTTTKLGEYNFGPSSTKDLNTVYLRFFDQFLKQKKVGFEKTPHADFFVVAENKWHAAKTFPEPGTKKTTWYLASQNRLGMQPGQGADKYTYDPSKAKVGAMPKPFSTDISMKVPKPKDGLFFESAPFSTDMTLEGQIIAKLFVRTDVVDTDLFVIVADVLPDGTIMAMASGGKLRLEYRDGFSAPKLMKPGKVYEVTVRPWWVAQRLPKGHRLAVMITSSAFPAFARNLNTGEPIATGTRMVPAHIQILHDAAHPSSVSIATLRG
jgi:hypothetical protein